MLQNHTHNLYLISEGPTLTWCLISMLLALDMFFLGEALDTCDAMKEPGRQNWVQRPAGWGRTIELHGDKASIL